MKTYAFLLVFKLRLVYPIKNMSSDIQQSYMCIVLKSNMLKDYFGLKCILSYDLLRPGSDNSISLWCKMRHTIDKSNYRSWFPFWDNCFVWLSFYLFFFKPAHNLCCKRHYPIIVITITRHVLYTGKCTPLYILEIIRAWPLCILWTRGHRYLLTHLYKIKTFG